MKKEAVKKKINKMLQKTLEKGKHISDVQVLIESGKINFSEKFIFSKKEAVDRPFHIASINKTFTAVLVGIMVEEGKMSFDDLLINYLDESIIGNLFIYKGEDYKDQVTIRQLLEHTSGVSDYFEGKTFESDPMEKLIIRQKNKMWQPIDLINFSKDYQKAVGKPGEKFYYSDTGYILLMMVLEKVAQLPYHQLMHKLLFDPLNMNDTYVLFQSEPTNPKQPINDIWYMGVEISSYQSLSVDWGGGVISTLDDLKKYVRSINHYEIISKETLDKLYAFKHRFFTGNYYGLGFSEYRFGQYFPTYRNLPKLKGHMGALSTQMFYDKETDTTVVMNFGSTHYTAKSVKHLIQMMALVFRNR